MHDNNPYVVLINTIGFPGYACGHYALVIIRPNNLLLAQLSARPPRSQESAPFLNQQQERMSCWKYWSQFFCTNNLDARICICTGQRVVEQVTRNQQRKQPQCVSYTRWEVADEQAEQMWGSIINHKDGEDYTVDHFCLLSGIARRLGIHGIDCKTWANGILTSVGIDKRAGDNITYDNFMALVPPSLRTENIARNATI